MEIYQIRSFVTVAEHSSLTKAALLLHVTQPAVSGHLKALENTLNLKLFERNSTGVQLTKAGQALLPRAQAILAATNEFRDLALDLQGKLTGKACVGTILDPSFIRLGQFMSSILDLYPWIEVELEHGISVSVIEQVVKGGLDAAFFLGHLAVPQVQAIALTDLAYRVVAPPGWKQKIDAADWADIATMQWICPPRMSAHVQMMTEIFSSHKLEQFKVAKADQEQTIKTLVTAGVGQGLMRADLAFAAQSVGEVCIWSKARPTTTLSFIYLREREGNPVIAALSNVVRKIWLDARLSDRAESALNFDGARPH